MDPNNGPKFRRGGKKAKVAYVAMVLLSQVTSDENYVNRIMFIFWLKALGLLDSDEDTTNESSTGSNSKAPQTESLNEEIPDQSPDDTSQQNEIIKLFLPEQNY